jgi:hypothetical protein
MFIDIRAYQNEGKTHVDIQYEMWKCLGSNLDFHECEIEMESITVNSGYELCNVRGRFISILQYNLTLGNFLKGFGNHVKFDNILQSTDTYFVVKINTKQNAMSIEPRNFAEKRILKYNNIEWHDICKIIKKTLRKKRICGCARFSTRVVSNDH